MSSQAGFSPTLSSHESTLRRLARRPVWGRHRRLPAWRSGELALWHGVSPWASRGHPSAGRKRVVPATSSGRSEGPRGHSTSHQAIWGLAPGPSRVRGRPPRPRRSLSPNTLASGAGPDPQSVCGCVSVCGPRDPAVTHTSPDPRGACRDSDVSVMWTYVVTSVLWPMVASGAWGSWDPTRPFWEAAGSTDSGGRRAGWQCARGAVPQGNEGVCGRGGKRRSVVCRGLLPCGSGGLGATVGVDGVRRARGTERSISLGRAGDVGGSAAQVWRAGRRGAGRGLWFVRVGVAFGAVPSGPRRPGRGCATTGGC